MLILVFIYLLIKYKELLNAKKMFCFINKFPSETDDERLAQWQMKSASLCLA